MYQFRFKGGSYPMGAGCASKFLLFLVSNGREISFFDARKRGIVTNVRADSMREYDPDLYETDCAVLKLFSARPGVRKRPVHVQLLHAGRHQLDRQADGDHPAAACSARKRRVMFFRWTAGFSRRARRFACSKRNRFRRR